MIGSAKINESINSPRDFPGRKAKPYLVKAGANWGLTSTTVFLLVLLTACPAKARAIKIPTTEDLMARSPIVCNGAVLKMENTLEKGVIILPNYPQMSVGTETWTAKIKVLGNIKGQVPDEIELHFSQIDQHPQKPTIISDGPLLARLQIDKRYRFYLKPVPGENWYVNALDGDYDDTYAIQPLSDIEPDNSPPPVPKDEAIQFASDFVKKLEPGLDISTIPAEATQWDGKWTVEFWSPPTRPHEAPATARIEVVGNHQIDRGSWVADFCTSSATDLKPSDLGCKFWIYMQMYPKDKRFYNMGGFPPMILLGTIKSITNQEIELSDVSQKGTNLNWPTLSVPIIDVQWFQRLNPKAVPTLPTIQ